MSQGDKMIHSVTLKNFKQHRNLSLDFSAGLNAITGENGFGKTTILKAILYALFGATAAGKKEHLTTRGSDGEMSVDLQVTIAKRDIGIFRSHNKALITSTNDGEILASGHTACSALVEDLLGLNHKMFRHLLYAAQGETQALLKMGAADLQRKLEEITKLNQIDEIVDVISKDLQELSGQLSVIDKTDTNYQTLDEEICVLTNELLILEEEIQEGTIMKDFTKAKTDAHKKLVSELAEHLNNVKVAKAASDQIKTSIRNVTNELIELRSYGVVPSKSIEKVLTYKLEEGKLRQQEYNAYLEKVKLARHLDAVAEAALNNHDAFVKLKPIFDDLDSLKALYDLDSGKSKLLEGELAGLKNQKTDCPTCKRPFDEQAHKHVTDRIQAIESEITLLKIRLNAHILQKETLIRANKIPKIISFKVEVENLLKAYDLAVDQLNPVVEEVNGLTPKFSGDVEDEISKLRNEYHELKLEYNHAIQYEAKVQACERQLVNLQSELSKHTIDDNEWSDSDLAIAQSELEDFTLELQKITEKLAADKYKHDAMERDKKTKSAAAVKAKENFDNLARIEKDQADGKALQTYLRNNRARIMADTWTSVTSLTSSYVSDITEGLISDLTRDSSGGFTVNEGGFTTPVEELSGARQSIVGLGLRVALGKAFFGNNSFILLDEVTADCSDNNAAAIAGMLQALDSQVLFVTHRTGDAVNATHIISL